MKRFLSLLIALSLSSLAFAAPAKKGAEDKGPGKEAVDIAKALTPTQEKKLLAIINDGDDDALTSLPGIGPKLAAAVKKARPVKDAADLVLIDGIGEATLKNLVKHAKDGFPTKETKTGTGSKKKKS